MTVHLGVNSGRLGREPDDFGQEASRSFHVGQPDNLTFTNSIEGNPLVSPDDFGVGGHRGSNCHVVFGPKGGFDDNKRGILRQGNCNDSSLYLISAAGPCLGRGPRQTVE